METNISPQMFSRIIDNIQALRAGRLSKRGRSSQAVELIQKLIKKHPNSIGYNLLLADFMCFSAQRNSAYAQYALAQDLLAEKEFSKQNKRFYNAYINFRKTALDFEKSGQTFDEWAELAKFVNELEADPRIKRKFRLPELP